MAERERANTEAALRETALTLRKAWQRRGGDGNLLNLRRGKEEVTLDLSNPEGRFTLLLLAILLAAKVQEAAALKALGTLAERGLTQRERLAARAKADEEAVLEVLQQHYRALANKAQKAAALFGAAERITVKYGGDLLNVREPGQPWQATLQALQEFPHLKSRAFWLCREMARHGLWPDLEPQACSAVDAPVKLALWRLGYVGHDAAFLREIPAAECLKAVDRFFSGDTLPLFYQGENLCRRGQPRLCLEECRVARFCLRPRQRANTEQPFGLSTGTCG
ncbi:MAG: hypothetical protein ACM3RP_08235 [Chitinophagales bacterium]